MTILIVVATKSVSIEGPHGLGRHQLAKLLEGVEQEVAAGGDRTSPTCVAAELQHQLSAVLGGKEIQTTIAPGVVVRHVDCAAAYDGGSWRDLRRIFQRLPAANGAEGALELVHCRCGSHVGMGSMRVLP